MIDAHPGHVVATVTAGTVVLRVLLLVGTAVLAGTAVSSRRLWTLPLLSAPLLVALVGTRGWFAGLVVAHVAAASVWLGSLLRVVVARQRLTVLRAVTPLAVTSAVVVAGSGAAMALADRVRLDGLLFDKLVLAKAGLLVLAAALGWRATRGRAWGHTAELTALLAAATIGAALIAVPSAPKAGTPLVTAADGTPITVVPQRPGLNLVHLDTDEPVTVNGIPGRVLPGATGQWASVRLPAGRSILELGELGTAQVDTGHGDPLAVSGAECASALLAGARRCPDASLDPRDAEALRALTSWLDRRGVRFAVRGDASARSQQAARLVTSATKPTALLLTGGWESTARELERIGRGAPSGGVYLAPWLLNGTLLSRYAVASPYVVLPFDPKGRDAYRYLGDAQLPSSAGYRAWGGATSAPVLWATTPASIFPTDLGHDHAEAGGWFPGGSLVAVAELPH